LLSVLSVSNILCDAYDSLDCIWKGITSPENCVQYVASYKQEEDR